MNLRQLNGFGNDIFIARVECLNTVDSGNIQQVVKLRDLNSLHVLSADKQIEICFYF